MICRRTVPLTESPSLEWPGGSPAPRNVAEFWQNVRDGVECISAVQRDGA